MQDSMGRKIEYVRVSLTEACNFACPYCRPKVVNSDYEKDILSVDRWMKILRAFSYLGIRAVRLTGGEPLLYPYLKELLAAIKQEQLFEDISLTTNGSLLAPQAKLLKMAGLDRVNISLDGLTDEIFREKTGGMGVLQHTLDAVQAAHDAGLEPIKINTVLSAPLSRAEIDTFLRIIQQWPVVWRFIEYMPFLGEQFKAPSYSEWKSTLEEAAGGPLVETSVSKGFGPAKYFALPNGGTVGFIFPLTKPYCDSCNRLRLSSQGNIRLCLLRPDEIPLATEKVESLSTQELALYIQASLQQRQAHHDGVLSKPGKEMWKIGG